MTKGWNSFCWICGALRRFVKTSAGFWECEQCGMAKSDGQIRVEQRAHGIGGGRGRRAPRHTRHMGRQPALS